MHRLENSARLSYLPHGQEGGAGAAAHPVRAGGMRASQGYDDRHSRSYDRCCGSSSRRKVGRCAPLPAILSVDLCKLTGDEAIMDKPWKTILLVTLMVTVFAGYVAFQFQR
jgi:hypothetical protein